MAGMKPPRKQGLAARDKPLELAGAEAYFIGIGGCGMSGLARLFAKLGARVRGSDIAETEVTTALREEGVEVLFDQQRGHLPPGPQIVVHSAAISFDHPELMAAE